MLLPQMLRDLVSARIASSLSFHTSNDGTEMQSVIGAVNGGVVANAICLATEGCQAAGLGALD
jgi:hypothetical protein